jgi:hypothetical protein
MSSPKDSLPHITCPSSLLATDVSNIVACQDICFVDFGAQSINVALAGMWFSFT